jgi:hypothetical protein
VRYGRTSCCRSEGFIYAFPGILLGDVQEMRGELNMGGFRLFLNEHTHDGLGFSEGDERNDDKFVSHLYCTHEDILSEFWRNESALLA